MVEINPTIVVLNDFCHVQGGASKVAIDEACGLARAGHRVIFLGAVGPICPQLQLAPLRTICLDQPELLDVARHPLVALQGMWNRGAWRAAKDLFATLDPATTIVHLHGYTKALSTSPLRAARRHGMRVVCTLHDFFAACPNGAFFNYQTLQPCQLRALSPACLASHCDKRRQVHKLFRVARSAAQRLDRFPAGVRHFITLSRQSGEKLRPYLPRDARLMPLPNVTQAEPGPAVDVAANQALVHIGRLEAEKGVLLLADAAQQAGRELLLVGDGPLRPMLEHRAGITITGWVTPEQVQAHLSRARALAFPSLWYETYGLVVAEAASRGVPALVSDISAPAERVRHGIDGWHVTAGNLDAWVQAIHTLEDDAIVAQAGAAAHRAFWDNPPTEAGHVAGLLAIYARILAESPSAVHTTAPRGSNLSSPTTLSAPQ